ncbi:hypothetical protein D3C85_1819630 [compost metagenome]
MFGSSSPLPKASLWIRKRTVPAISVMKVAPCLFLILATMSSPVCVQVLPWSVEYSNLKVAGLSAFAP